MLIPGFPTRELERKIRSLGFDNVIRTNDGEELALGPNLRIAIHVETSITDGPGGDSALVVSDGTARLVNQNDCRTDDLDALRAHGPVDLHWLQYSGAIWYPMVYEEPLPRMRELVDAKVTSQFARAMRYVEAIGARAVVPSAGPPAFLDPELFRFNVITGDELSIFPDQRSFLSRLATAGHTGHHGHPRHGDRRHHRLDHRHASDPRRIGRRDLRAQGRVPPQLPGRLDAVAHRHASQLEARRAPTCWPR